MDSSEALDAYLSELRRSAKLSVEQVCLRTKIQARYVAALEAGRWGEVPSNTHLRAFSLAMAKACGGDEALAAALVRRVLAAIAPVSDAAAGTRGFDTPSPAPFVAQAPLAAVPAQGGRPALVAAGPAQALGPQIRTSSVAAASARLRSLPLAVLLSLLALAGTLSYAAAWSVEHWRQRSDSTAMDTQAPVEAPAQASPAPAGTGAATASAGREAATAPAVQPAAAVAQERSAPASPAAGLTLRARRACWLVLEVDGRRLPTVTMQDGDKLNWSVTQRAVLLAGNVGALRIWWQGDNQGYLGDLGQRANAVVFEPGKPPRIDKSAALKLPAGVPE